MSSSSHHRGVVGDGVLGTEIAASARGLGLQVTLVGPQRPPLENHLGPLAADQLTRLHSEQGVALRLGSGLPVMWWWSSWG